MEIAGVKCNVAQPKSIYNGRCDGSGGLKNQKNWKEKLSHVKDFLS